MKRHLVAAGALVAAAALALSGCSSSGGGGDKGSAVTLNLLGADYGTGAANSTTKYWQGVADEFHKQNPKITVKVTTINWNDYDTKVKTQLQNKDYPDILEGEFFTDYAKDKLIEPVSDYADPNLGIATFKKLFSVNGAQYALPFTTSARAMFYNKKAFQAAGISAPPSTWDELKSDAAKLTAKGYIGFALPLGPEEAQAESYLWMLGNGGGWQDAAGKYAINSPQNVETFQFLKSLVAAGYTNPHPATYDRTANSAADFAAGKVGMEFNGPQLIPTIKSNGTLTASDYATAPVPGKTGPVNKTLGVADAIQVFKTSNSAKQDAIKKFMAFALNNKNQLAFANEYALLPGTQAAANTLTNDPVLGAFVKALPNTVLYPADANWTATVLPAVKQNIGTAVTGNPKQVLDQLQQKATSGS
ncbi:MAG TPA: extracellular solute-binding protein [Jatrophihabitans sp.]|nr:extracellular solute-binding protein [Jatrophihabitans sp.]